MLKAIKLTFRALTLLSAKETLYGGHFQFSTELVKPNYLAVPFHRRSTTVYPIIHRGTNTVTHSRRHQSEAYLLYKTMSGTQSISGGMFITLFPP